MDLLQTLLVYMSLVFATSVQTAPEPSLIPDVPDYGAVQIQATAVPTPTSTPVPTVDITPNPAYKTLQTGDKGAAVREMQEKLQEYGYYEGEVDGAYGNQTRRAVEHFQYMHGLTVDGIAGRHTLTVLFEYQNIRAPEHVDSTPEPTATAQMTAAAYTPAPVTPAPTVSSVTAVPAAQRTTAHPTVSPQEMSGFKVFVDETETELKAFQNGETVYLPIVELLRAAGTNVISSSTVELDEYAFASGNAFVRFTCTANQAGESVDLQAYKNDEPQLLYDRTLYTHDELLYVPLGSVEIICGFQGTVDENEKKIVILTSAE